MSSIVWSKTYFRRRREPKKWLLHVIFIGFPLPIFVHSYGPLLFLLSDLDRQIQEFQAKRQALQARGTEGSNGTNEQVSKERESETNVFVAICKIHMGGVSFLKNVDLLCDFE